MPNRTERIEGKKVAILGMARSGLALARLVKDFGGIPFVSDQKPAAALSAPIAELEKLRVAYETGGHTNSCWEGKDFLVISPGVPKDAPILQEAQKRALPVFGEVEVAYWLCQWPIAAVAGSNGKTTTTALLGNIFSSAGVSCRVAGNIGLPFSAVVAEKKKYEMIVLEISSFQLEYIEEFAPELSLFLNLSPDHLDRYASYEDYRAAKLRIFENFGSGKKTVVNYDDPFLREYARKLKGEVYYFSMKEKVPQGAYLEGEMLTFIGPQGKIALVKKEELPIKGPHNCANALAAAAAALAWGLPKERVIKGLLSFTGVPHRLEPVATVRGIAFVNDSKATNVDSVWYALQSVKPPIVWIAGGKDKGGSYAPLRELFPKRVKAMVLIGQARPLIRKALEDLAPAHETKTLPEAVEKAYELAAEGDTVLLSPACSSFDMFANFEERGEVFKESVMELKRNSETKWKTAGA
ncbi:MAG: UDP-N-acetylmuramoyl-L-alanine--D-glutamate ligase [candidate division Zixibacteria bacterium]|nr:UDP-N-acetylmuramoyl-L-alanine--D-glutamate ligase [candidate division Zixibacteria bacterium]MCI0595372.1 UDP-N-acetylmuramoyl-L-alanine--D-glutamate ligase [candidate division Zixibacteria bacterium]